MVQRVRYSEDLMTGLLIFHRKKAKFRRIFRGKFAEKKSKFVEKSADFARFLQEKSQNLQKNGPISRDFSGKKSNFGGKLRQETISKKQPITLDFFWQISLKSINFASI